jgi:hypothetical protein
VRQHLRSPCRQVRPLIEPLVGASVELYRSVCRELLPTPSKSHYTFNTRDLGKVVLGVMQVRGVSLLGAVSPCRGVSRFLAVPGTAAPTLGATPALAKLVWPRVPCCCW